MRFFFVFFIFAADVLWGANLAVLHFSNLASNGAVSSEQMYMLENQVEAGISQAGAHKVLERTQLDKVLAEQGLQQTGACDSAQCQIEMGRLLGVDKLVIGAVGGGKGRLQVTVKLVDVESGAIEWTEIADAGHAPEEGDVGRTLGFHLSGREPPKEPWYKSTSLWVGTTLGVAVAVPVLLWLTRDTQETTKRTVNVEGL